MNKIDPSVNITVDEEKLQAYLGNPLLKRSGQRTTRTPEQIKEYKKCRKDPIYFIQNYVKIVHVDKGLVPFVLWDYQKKLVKALQHNRMNIVATARQVGKSTVLMAFLLWYSIFHKYKFIAIIANKGETAREILGRWQLAYQHLPKWLQKGVVEWNKGSVELENGTKIVACATSSDSIRGKSVSYLFVDECAFVDGFDTFWKSTYPTISSGQETRCTLVSTPNGMNHFYKMYTKAKNKESSFNLFEVDWWEHPDRDEAWRDRQIADTSEEDFMQEYGMQFLGSANTLISSKRLKELVAVEPLSLNENLKIFEYPERGRTYFLSSDVSEGLGADYQVTQVIDITDYPHRQVAVYRDNTISQLAVPSVIYRLHRQYNDAFILAENNEIGSQMLSILAQDFDCENIISMRQGKISRRGLKQNMATKKIGCARLKDLIEGQKIVLYDSHTILELYNFVKKGRSFEADEGYHDDTVMSLANYAYFLSTTSFASQMDTPEGGALKDLIRREQQENVDAQMMPLPQWDGMDDIEEGEEIIAGGYGGNDSYVPRDSLFNDQNSIYRY